jgi:hypothetical protein
MWLEGGANVYMSPIGTFYGCQPSAVWFGSSSVADDYLCVTLCMQNDSRQFTYRLWPWRRVRRADEGLCIYEIPLLLPSVYRLLLTYEACKSKKYSRNQFCDIIAPYVLSTVLPSGKTAPSIPAFTPGLSFILQIQSHTAGNSSLRFNLIR